MKPRMQLLDHSLDGYVAYDTLRNRYEVAFQTTLLTYAEEELRDLVRGLSEQLHACRGCSCQCKKSFHLRSHDDRMSMAMSYAEMQRLVQVIEEALVTRMVHELMEGE
jgi:hypothetical protein